MANPHVPGGQPPTSPEQSGSTNNVIEFNPRQIGGFVFYEGGAYTNPIKYDVPGVREAVRVNRETLPGREDNWFAIDVNGFSVGSRVTEPLELNGTTINIVHLPGYQERIELGPGKAIHDRLADLFPQHRIISFASDGTGDTGEKLTRRNLWDHGTEEMAEERYLLLQALCGQEPIVLQGLSMGSVIAETIMDKDLMDRRLNAYLLHFDTALVTPSNVKPYMLGLFAPSMIGDVPRELAAMVLEHGVKGALGRLGVNSQHIKGNGLPSLVQMNSLRRGTDFRRILRVSGAIGTTTVSGELDPLAQFPMWKIVKRKNSGLHIATVRGRGHGMVIDGAAAADKMASVMIRDRIEEHLLSSEVAA